MDRQTRAARIVAKAGDINQDIVSLSIHIIQPFTDLCEYWYNCMPSEKDKLRQLPAELQHWVWSYLIHPADRLMLALTCKTHATVFEELKGSRHKTSASKRSAKATANSRGTPSTRLDQRRPPTKMDKLYILYRLQDWMPSKYRLCYECIRFRTRNRETPLRKGALCPGGITNWSGRPLDLTSDGLDEKEVMNELKAVMKTSHRCPECCQRAQIDTVSAKKCHQELKKQIAKLL